MGDHLEPSLTLCKTGTRNRLSFQLQEGHPRAFFMTVKRYCDALISLLDLPVDVACAVGGDCFGRTGLSVRALGGNRRALDALALCVALIGSVCATGAKTSVVARVFRFGLGLPGCDIRRGLVLQPKAADRRPPPCTGSPD